jgi:hypothetical protein
MQLPWAACPFTLAAFGAGLRLVPLHTRYLGFFSTAFHRYVTAVNMIYLGTISSETKSCKLVAVEPNGSGREFAF